MEELTITLHFLVRVGLPVMILVGIGVLIDRWQRQHKV
jgi:hypothetical protein